MSAFQLLITLVILSSLIFILLIISFYKKPKNELAQLLIKQQASRDEVLQNQFQSNRMELNTASQRNLDAMNTQLSVFADHQNKWFIAFQKQLDTMKTEIKTSVNELQKDNHTQLEKMRETVDEKLQKTLEQRLGHSFERVRKQLEAVQMGLGEMQNLATGVGDLKRVLSNVKTRGVMGEILLGNLLEQILTADQYDVNVSTIPNTSNHVEFAIKFPGNNGKSIWLPIDSKFPMDRYHQLQDAYENGDATLIAKAKKELIKTIKNMAKEITSKYVAPPHTTDFGVLFLPTEGLYADVVREPGIIQELQRDYRIMLAGPSNLAAFLNSLQHGFRTLAIEKRSSEVWNILASVKTEFVKFEQVISKVQTKLQQASNTIDQVGVRSRAIQRNLKSLNEYQEPTEEHFLEDGLQIDDLVDPNMLNKPDQ